MRDVVIAGAVRTPIGKFGGTLSGFHPSELGALAAKEALTRARVAPEAIEDVAFGFARQAGGRPNLARQVAFAAGVPQEVPAFTVNMACGSGLKAIDYAYRAVRDGDADVVLAGGVEVMSSVPYLLLGARFGYRMGHQQVVDAMYHDGLLCPLSNKIMGETAETLAERYTISRDEQDAFAERSQARAASAWKEGRFAAETFTVRVAGRKGETPFSHDEHPRPDTTRATLAKLPPVFKKDGSVTAGNASGITDGAAAMVVLSADKARALGVEPIARIVGVASAGVDPHVMGLGVVPATRRLLARLKLELADFDLYEVNEAFAAQVIACDRELRFDPERLNVNGGSIAIGHPIGCTGARITTTLLHEMARRKARRGLATLCISGGLGMAAAFERV